MEASSASKWVIFCMFLNLGFQLKQCSVTYDKKVLIINGQRRILFSGSIHYPRSTPEMWEGLIQKAKDGGLHVIDTYVFWNVHEPSPGNVYVSGISFRTDNEPFKMAMQGFTQKIVQMMKNENLFQSQGDPIILSQVDNEYGPKSKAYSAAGYAYMTWASKMADELDTGGPMAYVQGGRCSRSCAGHGRIYKKILMMQSHVAMLMSQLFFLLIRDLLAQGLAFEVDLELVVRLQFHFVMMACKQGSD